MKKAKFLLCDSRRNLNLEPADDCFFIKILVNVNYIAFFRLTASIDKTVFSISAKLKNGDFIYVKDFESEEEAVKGFKNLDEWCN